MSGENIYSLTFVLSHRDEMAFKRLAELIAEISYIRVEDVIVLSHAKSLDILMHCDDPNVISLNLVSALSQRNLPIDFCIQPALNRKKKLLICDMDSTLIGQECIDELADFAGVKDKVVGITEMAMRGELNFEMALKARVALLKGLPLNALAKCYQERITLNPGVRTLAATMKASGAQTVIVSGGFTFFSQRVAEAAGFEHHHANSLLEDGAALNGQVAMPILGRDAKLETLKKYAADFGGPSHAVAIGDGANDLAMIKASGLGIAYQAKPIVARAAQCAIEHTDLTTALYFQGYRESEFIRPA